jgi:predicted regulator of Ras-like GTPase activity (Roadblock/LC7/MglB family)
VVGEEIYKAASDQFEMKKLDSIIIKGRKGHVKIYEVALNDE